MERKCISKRLVLLLFSVSFFYFISGFFQAGFCLFEGDNKNFNSIMDKNAAQAKYRVRSDLFGLSKSASSLEFRQGERFTDNGPESKTLWADSGLYSKILRVMWIIVCALIGNIVFRKFMQVIFMHKSDGKKRSQVA